MHREKLANEKKKKISNNTESRDDENEEERKRRLKKVHKHLFKNFFYSSLYICFFSFFYDMNFLVSYFIISSILCWSLKSSEYPFVNLWLQWSSLLFWSPCDLEIILFDLQALKKEEDRTKRMEELLKLDERKRPYPFLRLFDHCLF